MPYQAPQRVYDDLDAAPPETRADLALRLIEEHPEHRLELPERDGRKANLCGVNLGADELRPVARFSAARPAWWAVAQQGLALPGADLRGASLVRARLGSADARRANLAGANLLGADLSGADLTAADLRGAELSSANLRGANLTDATLADARLQEADLTGATLLRADLARADLRDARLADVDLTSCTLTHLSLAGAYIERAAMRWEQFGGRLGDELAAQQARPDLRAVAYARAANAYALLGRNLLLLGQHRAASVVYRRQRRMDKRGDGWAARQACRERRWRAALNHLGCAAGDQAIEWLCDYGESPWRVVEWIAALLLIGGPGLLGLCGGLYAPDEVTQTCLRIASPVLRAGYIYAQYVLYTLDALTTAQFSPLQPANDLARFASGLLALAGIAFAGLLGFVAGQRVRRV